MRERIFSFEKSSGYELETKIFRFWFEKPRQSTMQNKIKNLVMFDYKGPRTTFREVDIFRAIFTIGQLGVVGRGKLGEMLELGPGATRTLIRRLQKGGMISIGKNGCILASNGQREYGAIRKLIFPLGEVDAKFLKIGRSCCCFVLKGKSKKVKSGVEQRDHAVSFGAKGALTMNYRGGRFIIPSDGTDCEIANPSSLWDSIREKGHLKEGDTVMITCADNNYAAETGGWSAAIAAV
jgi:hypothetical protein